MSDAFERLNAMIDPDQQTWDLSPHDVAAIREVLATCRRQAYKLGTIHGYCNGVCGPSFVLGDFKKGQRQACEYIKSIIESEVEP